MKGKRKESNASISTRRGSKPLSRRTSALNSETQPTTTPPAQESVAQVPQEAQEPSPSQHQQQQQLQEPVDGFTTPSPIEPSVEASTKATELQPKTIASASQPDGLSLIGASTVGSTIVATPVVSALHSKEMSHRELVPDANVSIYNTYNVGPSFGCKFPIPMIRIMVERLLKDKLDGKNYNANDAVIWTRDVADSINLKMRGPCHQVRYKHVVNVIIYQQTGAGCFYGARAIWDLFSDDFISISYDGGSFVCLVTLFGCYQY